MERSMLNYQVHRKQGKLLSPKEPRTQEGQVPLLPTRVSVSVARAAQTPAGLCRGSGKGVLRVGVSRVLARTKNTGNRRARALTQALGGGGGAGGAVCHQWPVRELKPWGNPRGRVWRCGESHAPSPSQYLPSNVCSLWLFPSYILL